MKPNGFELTFVQKNNWIFSKMITGSQENDFLNIDI